MHVHFVPESLMERRQNALQLARTAKEYGLSALVLKCREYCTVPIAKNRRHYASSSGVARALYLLCSRNHQGRRLSHIEDK